jgi:hypothetical protein
MMENKNRYMMVLILVCVSLASPACKKKRESKNADKELYNLARTCEGYTWYKNSRTMLNKSSGSGHPQPFLVTRYNAIAAGQLSADAKINAGAAFPEGSIIVKELYDGSAKLKRYAVLYKKPEHQFADNNGWVWGYINADGSAAEPSANKGKACISCHTQSGNIDYMLMNKYFP